MPETFILKLEDQDMSELIALLAIGTSSDEYPSKIVPMLLRIMVWFASVAPLVADSVARVPTSVARRRCDAVTRAVEIVYICWNAPRLVAMCQFVTWPKDICRSREFEIHYYKFWLN